MSPKSLSTTNKTTVLASHSKSTLMMMAPKPHPKLDSKPDFSSLVLQPVLASMAGSHQGFFFLLSGARLHQKK